MKRQSTGVKKIFLGRWGLNSVLLVILALSLLGGGKAAADNFVNGLKANGSLQPGLVVALAKNSTDTVVAAPANDSSRLYGVVIDPSQAPATIRNQSGKQVYVATNGSYSVLANTQNGVIRSGDYISISPTDGIAAKATDQQDYVLGRATEGYDGQSGVLVNGNNGTAIGRIKVDLNVIRNPLQYTSPVVPSPLKRVSESIAGRNVSALRVYAALGVFLVSAVLAGILLWGGVRNAMVSIGRNPLSRHFILRGLFQVIGMAAVILIIGISGVYLLLRL